MSTQIKDGEKIIEVEKKDAERIHDNLYKLKTLGQMVVNLDYENYVCGGEIDIGWVAMIFDDLHKETQDILFKYGLTV